MILLNPWQTLQLIKAFHQEKLPNYIELFTKHLTAMSMLLNKEDVESILQANSYLQSPALKKLT